MKRKRIIFGIILIAGAVLLLLGNMQLLNGIRVSTIIFTVLFAATFFESLFRRSIPGVLFSIAFLAIVYSKPLGIESLTPWPVLGAAFLASAGLSLIYHPKRRYQAHNEWSAKEWEDFYDTDDIIDDNNIKFTTTFGNSIKYVTSTNFKSAQIECDFGNMKVYFDNAVILEQKAVIHLDISFSGIELFIPKGWTVIDHTERPFSGSRQINESQPDGSATVLLTGDISFSEITLNYI